MMYKKNNYLLIAVLTLFSTSFQSCDKVKSGFGNSNFTLYNSPTSYSGDRTNDASLKAITIPCQDNHTFRMYYSDSAALLGLPDSITIVSYSKRTTLGYKECCIEVTSSATDTWLSTGFSYNPILAVSSINPKIIAGTHAITGANISMQHFTSVPLADSTVLDFNLAAQ